MDAAKQRQIASKGGRAAHQKGTAHEFTQAEARAAGRKGGLAAHEKGTAHTFTPEEARAAGRKGGHAAHDKGNRDTREPEESQAAQSQEYPMPGGNAFYSSAGEGGQEVPNYEQMPGRAIASAGL
jgi:general stress protein YciG